MDVIIRNLINQKPCDTGGLAARGKMEEGPASFLVTLQKAGITKQLQMSGNPGLTLPEDSGEFRDRQIPARTKRQNSEPIRFTGST